MLRPAPHPNEYSAGATPFARKRTWEAFLEGRCSHMTWRLPVERRIPTFHGSRPFRWGLEGENEYFLSTLLITTNNQLTSLHASPTAVHGRIGVLPSLAAYCCHIHKELHPACFPFQTGIADPSGRREAAFCDTDSLQKGGGGGQNKYEETSISIVPRTMYMRENAPEYQVRCKLPSATMFHVLQVCFEHGSLSGLDRSCLSDDC